MEVCSECVISPVVLVKASVACGWSHLYGCEEGVVGVLPHLHQRVGEQLEQGTHTA